MPYLSHILSSMRTYIEPSVGTMGVDEDGRLYVNEQWLETLRSDELAYVLLHEVLHLVLSHAHRCKSALPGASEQQLFIWNVAADLCIQQMLARHHRACEPKDGVKIDGCFPGTDVRFLSIPGLRPGMNTETYYGLLWNFFSQQMRQQSRQGGAGQKKPEQGSNGKPGPSPQQGDGKGTASALDPANAASSSDGKRRAYERPSQVTDKALLRSKLTECERRLQECEAKGIGSVPGELREALKARLHPQPDPFDQLRGIVSKSVASPLGADEYTYRRLCRHQPPDCARRRGVVRYAPECSIVVDTSGSMASSKIKDMALTAVAQGLRKVQRPRVVCFDTRVADERRLSSMRDFHWCGGGGTNMAMACEVEDKKHRPDAIVVITDGITGWPAKPTRARLIVALCKPSSSPPSWAKVVKCYEEVPKYAG